MQKKTTKFWLLKDYEGHVLAVFGDKHEAELSEMECNADENECSTEECYFYPSQKTNADGLKPCPLCGNGKVEYFREPISDEHRVECYECGTAIIFNVDFTDEEAKAIYNKRTC